MKRKEPPRASVKKAIRPVLYYPNAADDEPSQVIMPPSPPLGPRSSPDRVLARHRDSRRPMGEETNRRRSAVDNIGYEPENIPTPRAKPPFGEQSPPLKHLAARAQPASAGCIPSASRLFAPIRFAPPPAHVPDPDEGDASDYVVDTDDERPAIVSVISRTSTSPFKPRRPFQSPRRLQASPVIQRSLLATTRTTPRQSRPTNSSSSQQASSSKPPTPAEVIDLLSSSDSEPSTPTRISESPSLGSPHPYPEPQPLRAPSSEVELIDPPPRASSPDIEELPAPRSSVRKTRRRILSSPAHEIEPFPWRHVPSELRKRPLAPEFGDSSSLGSRSGFKSRSAQASSSDSGSTAQPEIGPRDSEDAFFRPEVREVSDLVSGEAAQSTGETLEREQSRLPPSSPPPIPSSAPTPPPSLLALYEPTPAPAPTPGPSKSKPAVRVLRMECVLLPRASRATLNALARFESQRAGKGKGKAKMSFAVEIPVPPKPKAGGGLGKGLRKGSHAAREAGRWESSSPRRAQEDEVDVDVEMEVDEIDLIQTRPRDESEFVVVDDDDEESSTDMEPEISFLGTKTPSRRKSGRPKTKRRAPTPSPLASPTHHHHSTRIPQTPRTPRAQIVLDPRIDLASTYRSLPNDIKQSGDKYCHGCRAVKGGRLKMRCTNQVSRNRKRRADGDAYQCGTLWCQRCIIKNGIEFDLFIEDFTCPICDDTCICDKCRKKREQEALVESSNVRGATQRSGGQGAQDEEQEQEPEQAQEARRGRAEGEQVGSSHRSSTLSEPPPPGDDEPDAEGRISSTSTNDPNAKRAGYAELMRQRGPTKWHGRRTPPPLRRVSNHVAAAAKDVYIPRGPVESEFESTTISPSVRADSPDPPAMDVDPFLLQSMLMASFDADYLVADASFMGADSAGLAIEMEDLLRVDELTNAEPDANAVDEAILGLGLAPTLPDDDSVFAGLDANLRAANRHFYDLHPHLRFGNDQNVMLASPDPEIFGFGAGVGGLGAAVSPAELSRSAPTDVYPPSSGLFDPEPRESVQTGVPQPEFEPEVVPDLTTDQSAKSSNLETPSPQFDADAGLEGGVSAGTELQDLFGGQVEDVSGMSGEMEEMPKTSTGQMLGAHSVEAGPVQTTTPEPTPVESAPTEATFDESSTRPAQRDTTQNDETSASFTFIAPTVEAAAQVQSTLKRRFQTQTQTQPPDQGRVTRSRGRRSH